MSTKFLPMWVVYDHPLDHPGKWVARQWHVMSDATVQADQVVLAADTLEEVRALLPPGLHRLDRSPADDPVIKEVWL